MATKSEYIIHWNGGGKKHRTADVPKTVYLPNNSTVGAGTTINAGVTIEQFVEIGNNCYIGYQAVLRHRATIDDECRIDGYVTIDRKAYIGAGSYVSSNIGPHCQLPPGTHQSMYIQGTRHAVTAFGKDRMVGIGCKQYAIEEWLKNFRVVGRSECYSAKEIREYGAYLQAAKVFLDIHYPLKKKTVRKTVRKTK